MFQSFKIKKWAKERNRPPFETPRYCIDEYNHYD